MWDRRQYKRFTDDVMDMYGKMVLADDVKILDISLSGISLKADRRLNIACNHMLNIEDKGNILTVKGRVIWSLLSENKDGKQGEIVPIYTAGMNFTDITKKKKKEIAEFIAAHFNNGHKGSDVSDEQKKEVYKQVNVSKISGLRIFIKANINAPGELILNRNKNFRVKELSPTDMLIESKQPLEMESKLDMEILLPEYKTISVLGCVASCCTNKDKDSVNYDIGIEFLDMPEKDWELLSGFIFLYDHIDEGT
ncbi:MAG: PilZ domain-containing protein [Thermodesulfovibrionales bacterium]